MRWSIGGRHNRAWVLALVVLWAGSLASTGCTVSDTDVPVAIADLDQDGVEDSRDQCENTPMPQPVDQKGCPIFLGSLNNVDFMANSADLGREARQALDDFIVLLNRHPSVVVAVHGHTDNRGSGIRNLELSKRRVMAVVRYLVARGVAPGRLRPYGFGEARPQVSNATAEGRKKNRRIEVAVVLPKP